MDRHRGERSGGGDRHRAQSRWSGSPTNGGSHRYSRGPEGLPGAGGGAGRYHPYKTGQEFDGGFRGGAVGGPAGGFSGPPMGVGGPMPGPRHSGFPSNSPDREVRSGYVKLFIGSVPRTATEEEVRPLFEEHGNVIEVAFIKDKKTGEQQGCCFVKYGTTEEAERAIRALHNNYTLSNGIGPIQVRYADGERGHGDRGHANLSGVAENKLFVAQMNKQANAQEIEEIFAPFGQIEDVYIMRDAMKQSRGCGFVKFSTREQATEAMNTLNGQFTMRGCDQALIVRFADPKRPRTGDSRGAGGGPAFGGPGFSPRSDTTLVIRPTANLEEQRDRPWGPSSPPAGMAGPAQFNNFGPDNLAGSRVGGPGPGPITTSSDSASVFTPGMFPSNGSLPKLSAAQPSAQLGVNPSMQQIRPGMGPQNPPQNFPPLQLQNPQQIPPQNQSFPPAQQMQNPQQQQPFNPQMQQQQQYRMQQQMPQMMLQQQQQALQSSFQSSQQAIMQLQQQLQMMKQQQGGNTPSGGAQGAMMPSSNNMTAPPLPSSTAPVCNWTEHTSPEGFKYYYNSITKESKWEKPEEFAIYEQQKLMMMQQQMPQSQPQMQMKPFMQQPPVQFQGGQQGLQDINFAQLQAAGSNIDPTRIQQGIQAAQEWAWKNKPPGP
ncbi:hypothetical protein LUZ60_008894 [Juncus effusus]|nr:hypothetical protein LUZ60_008894 [Juncus effusus]